MLLVAVWGMVLFVVLCCCLLLCGVLDCRCSWLVGVDCCFRWLLSVCWLAVVGCCVMFVIIVDVVVAGICVGDVADVVDVGCLWLVAVIGCGYCLLL